MKKVISKIKDTVISGIVLFLPIFILLSIFKSVYTKLYKYGHKLTEILGLDNAGDKKWVPFVTLFLVVVLFFICGLLARFAMIGKMKEWIENNVLLYIPTYSKYKAKMTAKLQPAEDVRPPVLVELNGAWKPGFLINTIEEKATVFLPTTPDIDYGEVWIVENTRVSLLEMTTKEFKTSLLLSGKGMKTEKSTK
nr:DUF502 domain-containing protein [uncultured Flavobacterium sp.]